MTKLFPTLILVLSIAAAGSYAVALDWRRALYWTAGAVIAFVVTY